MSVQGNQLPVDESISNQEVKSEETREADSPLRTQAITTDGEIGIPSAAPAAGETAPFNYGPEDGDAAEDEVIEIPDRPVMVKSKKYSYVPESYAPPHYLSWCVFGCRRFWHCGKEPSLLGMGGSLSGDSYGGRATTKSQKALKNEREKNWNDANLNPGGEVGDRGTTRPPKQTSQEKLAHRTIGVREGELTVDRTRLRLEVATGRFNMLLSLLKDYDVDRKDPGSTTEQRAKAESEYQRLRRKKMELYAEMERLEAEEKPAEEK